MFNSYQIALDINQSDNRAGGRVSEHNVIVKTMQMSLLLVSVSLEGNRVQEWSVDGGLQLGEQLIQLIIEILGVGHRVGHVVDDECANGRLLVVVLHINVDNVHDRVVGRWAEGELCMYVCVGGDNEQKLIDAANN